MSKRGARRMPLAYDQTTILKPNSVPIHRSRYGLLLTAGRRPPSDRNRRMRTRTYCSLAATLALRVSPGQPIGIALFRVLSQRRLTHKPLRSPIPVCAGDAPLGTDDRRCQRLYSMPRGDTSLEIHPIHLTTR